MPSFSNDFKVRETTSLALPRFRAICSCVVESTGEPVRMRSSSRYPATILPANQATQRVLVQAEEIGTAYNVEAGKIAVPTPIPPKTR